MVRLEPQAQVEAQQAQLGQLVLVVKEALASKVPRAQLVSKAFKASKESKESLVPLEFKVRLD
jgi:hypothetical protein